MIPFVTNSTLGYSEELPGDTTVLLARDRESRHCSDNCHAEYGVHTLIWQACSKYIEISEWLSSIYNNTSLETNFPIKIGQM